MRIKRENIHAKHEPGAWMVLREWLQLIIIITGLIWKR